MYGQTGTMKVFSLADPLHPNQGFLGVGWGNVAPFALVSGSQFRAPPPPSLTSKEYTDAFNQVKALGGDGIHTPTSRTPEQTIIGAFWGYDGSPNLGTPPREYNQIVRIIAQQQGNTHGVSAVLLGHNERVDDVALGLRHLLPLSVANEAVNVDLPEGDGAHELETHHDHARDPEEDDIEAGDENARRIVARKLRCLVRPAKRRERPEGRGEPGVEHIFIAR